MKKSVANILHRLAQMILEDDTPSDEEIRRRRMRVQPREEAPPSGDGGPTVPKPRVQEEKVEYTAPPERRAPIRLQNRARKNKWNEEDKTGLMKDYMKDYRSEGNDVGNRYVKKPKV